MPLKKYGDYLRRMGIVMGIGLFTLVVLIAKNLTTSRVRASSYQEICNQFEISFGVNRPVIWGCNDF